MTGQTRPPDHLIVVDNDDDDRGAGTRCGPTHSDHLPRVAPKPRRRRRFRARHAACAGPRRGLGVAGRRRRQARGRRRARHAAGLRGKAFAGRGVADGVRPRRPDPAGVPAAPRPGVAAAGRRTARRRRRAGPAARHRVAVQRRAVPRVDAGSRWRAGHSAVHPRRRGGGAPPAGAVRAAVRHLPGRGVPAPAGHRRVQADPRRPDAHPVPRRRRPSGTSPTATADTCSRSPACVG